MPLKGVAEVVVAMVRPVVVVVVVVVRVAQEGVATLVAAMVKPVVVMVLRVQEGVAAQEEMAIPQ